MCLQKEEISWDSVYKGAEFAWGREPDWELRAYLSLIPRGKALDLGIGDGRNALFLAKNGFEVEGIDISEEAIGKCCEFAEKESLRIEARVADVREFFIPQGAYACIICSHVLPFLKRSEAEALIEKIKAGLAPDGVAYVAAFTAEDPGYRRLKERGLPDVEPNTFFSPKFGSHFFYFEKGGCENSSVILRSSAM